MKTYTYHIEGMSCQHCVNAITEEVSEVQGVENIEVSLENESLTFNAAEDLKAEVTAAVDEAGYTLA